MTNFRQSNEYAVRRATRDCIRRASNLTRSEREILQHLAALWYHHRNGAGVIRPGKAAIAKKCQCSIPTVTRALARFRKMALITPVRYAKGGRNATRYTVNISSILMQLDGYLLSISGADFVLQRGETRLIMQRSDFKGLSEKNDPVIEKHKPDQNDPRSICMFQPENQRSPISVSGVESLPKRIACRTGGRPVQNEGGCEIIPFPKFRVIGGAA